MGGISSGTGESVCLFCVCVGGGGIMGEDRGFLSPCGNTVWRFSKLHRPSLRFLFCCFLFIVFFDRAAEPEGSWFLVLPGIESVPPAVKAWRLNHGDSRGVPQASHNES